MPLGLGHLKGGLSSMLSTPEKSANTGTTSAAESIDDIDEIDGGSQSILMGIISQLRPGCDLSRITLPTFILERKSMLERITNQLQQPELLLEARHTADATARFVGVVKWYLSGWHIAPKAVKKPLNPVLGEHFTCYWDLPGSGERAYYIAEQTSHHPPESAYFYAIPDQHLRVDGLVIPKSRFLGNSTAAMMEGKTILTFEDLVNANKVAEAYVLTQPNMYARGILIGNLKLELGDQMVISCENLGLEARIEFKTKGFIYGTYDAIEGIIRDVNTGQELYEISGKWNEIMYLKDLATGTKTVLLDTSKAQPLPPSVRPLSEQSEFESRRLWHDVTEALSARNHEQATDAKFKIEDAQRIRAKLGNEVVPRFFKKTKAGDVLPYRIAADLSLTDPKQRAQAILALAPILPESQ
ncbi:hypothetical protein BABINDRAFT_163743 [Babjeviella inositovora NRRL Y-12698]|uniref:Oxysterol-binding protein n=1 Tax=Babjeviella inositovora NRRL Y-12698 TaxID=984486 RepID=A0A1E3QJJ6_9ASCO|nr:uncharacterized protein BABINDRAFT_163743 [Babjeviella inositovora NRRL Y-12698]ODQ77242.1 hypothetical protein BABINDRAFT_163743 [Babjeviella inositovora NRRL Y-12698]